MNSGSKGSWRVEGSITFFCLLSAQSTITPTLMQVLKYKDLLISTYI
jgi:hypothetical protein